MGKFVERPPPETGFRFAGWLVNRNQNKGKRIDLLA